MEPYLETHPSCSESKGKRPPDPVLTAPQPPPPPTGLCTPRERLSPCFGISLRSSEGAWKSEKASWLYVFKFILFPLLITYIPFRVIGAILSQLCGREAVAGAVSPHQARRRRCGEQGGSSGQPGAFGVRTTYSGQQRVDRSLCCCSVGGDRVRD